MARIGLNIDFSKHEFVRAGMEATMEARDAPKILHLQNIDIMLFIVKPFISAKYISFSSQILAAVVIVAWVFVIIGGRHRSLDHLPDK